MALLLEAHVLDFAIYHGVCGMDTEVCPEPKCRGEILPQWQQCWKNGAAVERIGTMGGVCHGFRRLDTRSLPTARIGRNSMNDHADIIRGTDATQRRCQRRFESQVWVRAMLESRATVGRIGTAGLQISVTHTA